HEIHAPLLVGGLCRWQQWPQGAHPLPADLAAHREPFEPIQAVHAFVIDAPTFPAQQGVQSSIAIADPHTCQLAQTHTERRLVIGAAAIPIRAPMAPDHPACSPFTYAKADAHEVHQRLLLRRLYSFFRSTSWSMCRSKVRSATSCFRRRFSSSNCR